MRDNPEASKIYARGDLFRGTANVYLIIDVTDDSYVFFVPTLPSFRKTMQVEHGWLTQVLRGKALVYVCSRSTKTQ
jgi:hypothetical protein